MARDPSRRAGVPELIRCVPLACSLMRARCGDRHIAAKRTAAGFTRTEQQVHSAACASCAVGAAHARGETPTTWPDGAPIEVRLLTLPRSEERSDPEVVASPSVALDRGAPRAAEPAHDPPRAAAVEEEDMGTIDRAARVAEGQIEWRGERRSAYAWARDPRVAKLGISHAGIKHRIARGWTVEEALTLPKGQSPDRLAAARPHGPARGTKLSKPRSSSPAAEVRATLTSIDPVELLRRLGWEVDEIGAGPTGRLIVVKEQQS